MHQNEIKRVLISVTDKQGIIEFAQERDKFRGGAAFLREAIEISHVRHSPLKEQIIALLGLAGADAPR